MPGLFAGAPLQPGLAHQAGDAPPADRQALDLTQVGADPRAP